MKKAFINKNSRQFDTFQSLLDVLKFEVNESMELDAYSFYNSTARTNIEKVLK